MANKIIVAIDGNSGCGKSSTAKVIAKKLNYTYIDTGAMYRAVTKYFLDNSVNIDDPAAVTQALENIHIRFNKNPKNGKQETYTNGMLVEDDIRSLRVSQNVSAVSKLPAVRDKMVAEQQAMGMQKGIVMDGRDIGTVVFPDADLKVFMTASIEARAQRRWQELKENGKDTSLEEVKENLEERDRIDSGREHSPLKKAVDAYLLDTSDITFDNQVDRIYKWAINLIEEK